MRFWFDTEFIEDGKTIDLASIAIVAEDGRAYYAESSECDLSRANPWVKENVVAHLGKQVQTTRGIIAQQVLEFVGTSGDKPEFWGYYADYDWVALCQLYGPMVNLPKGWPMYCRDIKQWCDDLGNPKLPPEGKNEHHALADALWNRKAWEFLKSYV